MSSGKMLEELYILLEPLRLPRAEGGGIRYELIQPDIKNILRLWTKIY